MGKFRLSPLRRPIIKALAGGKMTQSQVKCVINPRHQQEEDTIIPDKG